MPSAERQVNKQFSTSRVCVDYAHVGLMDVQDTQLWIARKRWGTTPVNVSHAKLLKGGGQDTSTADKDRFMCYWFHTPNSGEGFVHGYPIEWDEAHLLIRLDPNWDYKAQKFIANAEHRKIERNIDAQYDLGQRIYQAYISRKPLFPLSWHMIGPRAADSMFYIERHEPE